MIVSCACMTAEAVAAALRALGTGEQQAIQHVIDHLAGPRGTTGDQLARLTDTERAFVAAMAQRVKLGAAVYGELEIDTDRRDMLAEALAEVVDAAFYVGVEAEREALGVRRAPLSRVVELGLLLQGLVGERG